MAPIKKLACLLALLPACLAAPAAIPEPDHVVALEPRATSSAAATITPGSSGPSPSSINAAIAGCANANLFGVNDNDILAGVCKPFTLIFARGTFEAGNIGGIVGPPFVAALKARIGANNVAVQGVNNYPADIPGFLLGGSASGSVDMAVLIQQTLNQCPSTKLCIAGYSQGAQVVHNAANLLSTAATNFVNSVVLFGDPDDGYSVGRIPGNKVSVDCHATDNICQHGDLIFLAHLDYCLDVGGEANFAASQAGF